MLTQLSVENYALIDSLRLAPAAGFSVVTGETGAGKSIMLGALSLLLGDRADTRVIADKERKSVTEAIFTDIDPETSELITAIDPEWDGTELIVRREISPSGRSRAFINDTPVRLADLAAVTSRLVDIHSQHSNIYLSEPKHQLEIIDTMAGDANVLAEYRQVFSDYLDIRNHIRDLKEANDKIRANRAMYEFQLEQLDRLKPKAGELEAVEKRFDLLSDAEEIREHLSEASFLLSGSDKSALNAISDAIADLGKIDLSLFEDKSKYGDTLMTDVAENPLITRLRDVYVELKDIAETVEGYNSDVEADPSELARVSARMNQLYEANKQFHITEPDGLVRLHEDIKARLAAINGEEEDVAALEAEMRSIGKQLKEKAASLSEIRRIAASEFAALLEDTARPLGLPNIRFEVEMESGKLTRDGADTVRFLCSFNKNMPLSEMQKVASGGEISRLMLSIKAIVAGRMKQPTVIFDEIDTGVSGEIAYKMAEMMKDMSRDMQVMAITHLPQVAAKGDVQFKVYKRDTEERTVSALKLLSAEERVDEIAGMLSGSRIDEAARQNARSLLKL